MQRISQEWPGAANQGVLWMQDDKLYLPGKRRQSFSGATLKAMSLENLQ